MLKVIGVILVVAIAAVLLLATTKPDTFHVERTASINAGADTVYAHITNLRAWEAWSPYLKLDPEMKSSYTGAQSGAGAGYEWEGNSKVGAGRMTITNAAPPSRVDIKLEMLKPFAATNDVAFILQPNGTATDVTWAMDGTNNFIAKIMDVFFDMDRMVGGQFEEGLANLKSVVEKSPEPVVPEGASASSAGP